FVSPNIPKSSSSQETPSSIVPLANLPPSIERELEELEGIPSPSSSVEVDLSSLIADIRGRYTSQESVPQLPFPTLSGLARSNSMPADSSHTLTTISLFNTKSMDDLVTLVNLKNGAPSRIRARWTNLEGPSSNPNPSPVTKTRFKVKAFFEKKLLKGKM
ncbi:hypothetical protein HAX54_030171, partial [Datura stramonium]|nr:hypothetical protein [Datura stramonium]